ncbi:putative baseplate assembly protein [Salinadaptatus halalkaliphilus]|uniref:Putative baseplate assembly protein n=1 Tax=Salinadaptatus halalkaliphilus TaxID=2419781 RepID=A0A4S3TL17_9EURY|nr:putative baseplate assembly protein [Salinadaptatus halalkaliphilus]THE64849.1 putative baseplate assembly protein [Salinadaptatus halalkaliphilus]
MGLDLPELDDREYDALLDQATKLIPAYSEEWTDFNPHDPGMTIVEVLAWLTETHTYQLDQITDDHRRKYLQLVGYRPRAPTAATATVRVGVPEALGGKRLPAGAQLGVTDGVDDRYQFETERDLVCVDACVDTIISDVDGGSDHSEANAASGSYYRPFGRRVDETDTVYVGFDDDPFAETDRVTLYVAYHDDDLPDPPEPTDDGRQPTFDPSVELAWECYRDDGWERLTVLEDETDSLYRGGIVELEANPTTQARRSESVPSQVPDSAAAWIRCRVDTAGYEIPPQLDSIRTNVVTATHATSVETERLDPLSDGSSSRTVREFDNQTYRFANKPVLSARVFVDGQRYTEVPDFDASGPEDCHYVLDREAGYVTFGDGFNGTVPPANATVIADYVYGGGERANVSAAASWQLTDPGTDFEAEARTPSIDVAPLGPASGGADGETVAEALQRAKRDLDRPNRAVTASDYRRLAARTPGLRIGRTHVTADSEGVTVIVIPYAPADVPSPDPSAAFLDTVRTYLRERTLLGDRFTVVGPQYVRLEITVSGEVRPQYAHSGFESAIVDAVESYLHPLDGFDGDGWPLGRSLEIEALRDSIADVDPVGKVSDLSVTAHGGTPSGDRIRIGETALFSVECVTVEMQRSTLRRG